MTSEGLDKIGFCRDWIYETIICSSSGEAEPDAAPMGVWSCDLETIRFAPYKTSKTFRNVDHSRCFTVNLTGEIFLFYNSLYAKEAIEYVTAGEVNAPVLKEASRVLEARVIDSSDLGDRVLYVSEIVSSYVLKEESPEFPLNRGKSLALEALIKASRLPHISAEEQESVRDEIRRIARAVRKVSPGSSFEQVVSKLSSL